MSGHAGSEQGKMIKEIAELISGLKEVRNLNAVLQEENDNLMKQLKSEIIRFSSLLRWLRRSSLCG